MDRILVVDHDPDGGRSLESLLLDHGFRVTLAGSSGDAVQMAVSDSPSLVVMVVPLAGIGGLETLARIRRAEPKLPVIMITASGSTEEAIQATRAGAFDYVLQPFEDEDFLTVVAQGLEAGRLMRSPVSLEQEPRVATGDALVGRSRPMQEIYKAIGRVAPTDATVLIRGESGTGKELVARAVYQYSTRGERPFIVVNCVAIPETLLESELFGYEKGAFTGAVGRRIGKIEHANRGTLFLDEIGDMPLAIQAKLLRLLQERSIERIGGNRPIAVDVRIIAATNRDLEAAIIDGRFREDLFYRLNVVPINLPHLRDRLDDVPLLCDYFMDRLTLQLGVRNPGITAEASRVLQSHSWPGNVRELANTLEQCLIFSRGRPVGADEVRRLVMGGEPRERGEILGDEDSLHSWLRRRLRDGGSDLLAGVIDKVCRQLIVEALRLTQDNRTRAAKLLGVSRPTLLAKMDRYGLRD